MPRMFLKLEELAKVIRILIFKDIQTILEKARSKSFKAINTAMVQAYWHIGKVIVEEEQRGKQRAEYGKALLEGLSEKLS